ncbi:hypothetical protein [Glycomyces terrestris]|uniref:Uncharacterized protein n=1 Tax=Glycomyces terrestris TaxID=2493553 RepID=A0A426V4U1_9ACTN|nr:hypothetical protein [Glycomyces terrestris]RRS01851.1 hypothetical protein EIW28_03655 [Glycomyces terrestris]
MTQTPGPAAAAIRDHAGEIDDLRRRLEGVRFTSALIDRGAPAPASMLAWISARLEPHVREQDRIVEFLAGNLSIAAARLRATAAAFEGEPDAPPMARVTATSYWAPEGESAPSVDFAAEAELAAQIQGLARTMAVEEWAEGSLAEPRRPAPLDTAAVAAVPHGVEKALEFQPDVLAAQVRAWRHMSAELQRIAQDLRHRLVHDMPEWTGEAHAAYCWLMEHNVNSAVALGGAAAGLAAAIEGVGIVTAATRELIRERTAALLHVLNTWAENDDQAPTTTQLVTAAVQWALTVASHLAALARSLRNLNTLLRS